MKKKKAMKAAVIGGSAAVLLTGWIAFCGYYWGWGPFIRLHDLKMAGLTGNASRYAPENTPSLPESPLVGKTVVFLGSSVTYGASSKGVSFADYIAARNGCISVKEAVSGTTLVDGPSSYIRRLRKLKTPQVDLFVCQLSTNDASQSKPLGTVSDSRRASDFDTSTVAGAIEYITAYAREMWNCPVVFYTNPRYDSPAYGEMVELLHKLVEKWGIAVIDLWSDEDFNAITEERRALYMADIIHPTQAGYLEWWTPMMEQTLYRVMEG